MTLGAVVRAVRLALGASAALGLALALAPARALRLKAAARAPVAVHRRLAFALGLGVERRGAPAAGPARLIVANHVSWLDIVALGALEPFTFVAKSDLAAGPLARAALALQGVILVDRRRRFALPKAVTRIAGALRRGESVVLFAEGTTGDGNRLLPLRSSLLQGAVGAAVQPVLLEYRRRAGLVVSRRERPGIAWYGDMTFWPHLGRLVREGDVACHVTFAAPLDGAGRDRKALALACEAALRTLSDTNGPKS